MQFSSRCFPVGDKSRIGVRVEIQNQCMQRNNRAENSSNGGGGCRQLGKVEQDGELVRLKKLVGYRISAPSLGDIAVLLHVP